MTDETLIPPGSKVRVVECGSPEFRTAHNGMVGILRFHVPSGEPIVTRMGAGKKRRIIDECFNPDSIVLVRERMGKNK